MRNGKETAELDPLGVQIVKKCMLTMFEETEDKPENMQGAIKKYTDIFEKQIIIQKACAYPPWQSPSKMKFPVLRRGHLCYVPEAVDRLIPPMDL